MVQYYNDELQNLYLLMKALKRNDNAAVSELRSKTGVQDDLETLVATLRFMQIGIVPTYAMAKMLYDQEKEIILKTEQNRNAARFTYEHMETMRKINAQQSWAKESQRAALNDQLSESRKDLKDAQTYHSAVYGDDD